MQRLINITNDQILSGLTRSQLWQNGGLFTQARGMYPFVKQDETALGVMAWTPSSTTIASGYNNPTAMIAYNFVNAPFLLMVDANNTRDGGTIYALDYTYAVNGSFTDGATANKAFQSMAILSGVTDDYVVASAHTYAAAFKLFDFSAPANHSFSFTNSLQPSPLHSFADSVYGGHSGGLYRFYEQSAGVVTHVDNVLDFRKKENCSAISDDGRYIVFATFENPANYASTIGGNVHIYWWNEFDGSYFAEYKIPNERIIFKILKTSSGLIAVGKNALYSLSAGAQPQRILSFASSESSMIGTESGTPTSAERYTAINSAATFDDGLIWGNNLSVFAKGIPEADMRRWTPFTHSTGQVLSINTDFEKDTVLVGENLTGTIKRFNFGSASYNNNELQTRAIWFDSEYNTLRVDLILPYTLNTNNSSLSLRVFNDNGDTTASIPISYSDARYSGKTYLSIYLPTSFRSSSVRVGITPTAGKPMITSFSIWGDKGII